MDSDRNMTTRNVFKNDSRNMLIYSLFFLFVGTLRVRKQAALAFSSVQVTYISFVAG